MKRVFILTLVIYSSISLARNASSDTATCSTPSLQGGDGLNTILSVGNAVNSEVSFATKLCDRYSTAIDSENLEPLEELKIYTLKEIGEYEPGIDLDDEEVDKKIIQYFNDNKQDLICNMPSLANTYQKEHFYKRAISDGSYELFNDFLTESDFPVDYNAIENRNGKEETLLDFLDMKIRTVTTPQLVQSLKNLRSLLWSKGARTAKELENE